MTGHDIDTYAEQKQLSQISEADLRKIEKLRTLALQLDRPDELQQLVFMQNSRQKAEIESIYGGDGHKFCLKYLVDKLSTPPSL